MTTVTIDLEMLTSLAKALRECSEDLEAELNSKHSWRENYSFEQRRFERDMQPVIRANELLRKLREAGVDPS